MKTIFGEAHYSIKEVAEILGISTASVHSYIKAGSLKAIKIGGQWYAKEIFIKEYLQQNTNFSD